MSSSMLASIEKLKQSSQKLNKITDEASQVVTSLETYLNKECSIGIETYVLVTNNSLDEEGMVVEQTYLGYERVGGRFRITVRIGVDEHQRCKPWTEWDRETKLETITKLPELIERIAKNVDDHISSAQQSISSAADVLKILSLKGSK